MVELAEGSVNVFDADYPERPCFLLGAELGGVPQELVEEADPVVSVELIGPLDRSILVDTETRT